MRIDIRISTGKKPEPASVTLELISKLESKIDIWLETHERRLEKLEDPALYTEAP